MVFALQGTMTQAIRILIVDDSPFVCGLLADQLRASGLEVVGTALNGRSAVEQVARLRPDAVTLDLEMPGMGGLEVLDRIMRTCPTPVIVVSGVSRRGAAATLEAVNRGAVDFILKFSPGADTDPEALRHEIVSKVRVAAGIKVIRSLQPLGLRKSQPPVLRHRAKTALLYPPGGVVVIGASTGGPLAVRNLLGNLDEDFAAAIIVVQHMPATFTGVLAAQLDSQIVLPVKEADDGDRLEPGLVLVARGDHHLLLRSDGTAEVRPGPKIAGHCPSIDVTMQSVAQVYGPRAKGVVLTGMGSDGAMGLVAMWARGGQTFAQDPETCVVDSMPRQAIAMGIVDHVGPPEEIARLLSNNVLAAFQEARA
jgi:two-component system, chemotaxis family, protein-glutamate methylesterase/glutaminase